MMVEREIKITLKREELEFVKALFTEIGQHVMDPRDITNILWELNWATPNKDDEYRFSI